jgi:hypothetical protein
LGTKGEETTMGWSHRITQIGNQPAQILIDDGYRATAPIRELSGLAWFGVYCQSAPVDCFWEPAETDKLDDLEDDLIQLCHKFGEGKAIYVMRIATRGVREYFMYFGDSAKLNAVLPNLKTLHSNYRIEYDEKIDPGWNRYISCLPKQS